MLAVAKISVRCWHSAGEGVTDVIHALRQRSARAYLLQVQLVHHNLAHSCSTYHVLFFFVFLTPLLQEAACASCKCASLFVYVVPITFVMLCLAAVAVVCTMIF